MSIFRRIISVLCLPVAFFMLITGLSFVSADRQKSREADTEKAVSEDFKPIFRFAVASDIHINAGDSINPERLKKLFTSAYRYADNHPTYKLLDAVVMTGDNCDTGADAEYEILKNVINENKRDETALVAIMGNHEFHETAHEGFVRHMQQDLNPHVVIKGFHFIGISPSPSDTWQTPLQINWLRQQKLVHSDVSASSYGLCPLSADHQFLRALPRSCQQSAEYMAEQLHSGRRRHFELL